MVGEGMKGKMELAQRTRITSLPRATLPRPAWSGWRGYRWGMARVAIACAIAGLLPLAGVMAFIVTAPGARVSSLVWPLVVMTIVATALAILGGLALGHPQQRSLIQLHRLTRRALGGDQLASVALDAFTPELRPIAADLAPLARELERLRTAGGRGETDLRGSAD